MTVAVIALNTFKEAIRDRILYLLLFFAATAILFSRVLALLTVGDRMKIIKDVGLASISLFGALMAILIGTGLVYKEIEKRTIFTLISKPIRRHGSDSETSDLAGIGAQGQFAEDAHDVSLDRTILLRVAHRSIPLLVRASAIIAV